MLSSSENFTSVGAELSDKDVHLDERFTAFAIGTAAAKMMPLRTSALRQNINLVTVGEGKTLGKNWQRDRWNMFLEELKGYKNDTVVLHVDGYDVLFVQSADALWSEYQRQVDGKGEGAILFGITTAGMYTPCRKGYEHVQTRSTQHTHTHTHTHTHQPGSSSTTVSLWAAPTT